MSAMAVVFVASAALAAALTGAARRYALSRAIVDVPNPRSSHLTPRPRGGGLAIVAVTLAGITAASAAGYVPPRFAAALAGGGVLVAAVGWLDDRRNVRPIVRFLVHVVAAAWAIAWLGGLPALRLGSVEVALGVGGWMVAGLVIVWGINLYNFMDGIDGLAGGQALVAAAGAAFLLQAGGHPGLAGSAAVVGGASAGFLLWNWPPAKIFMGDVGSGFLGFIFAALAIASERMGGVPLIGWVLLLGVFVFDATATLLRRLAKGERVYEAHRRHAYQRAVQSGWSHGRVSGAALLLGGVLTPLAGVAMWAPERFGGAVLAGTGLLALAYIVVERRQPMWGGGGGGVHPRAHATRETNDSV